jgi:hypothetical protein
VNFSFPIVARYAFWVLIAFMVFDLVLVAGAAITLYRAGASAHMFTTSGYVCVSYAPTVAGRLYMIARCKREEPE